MNEPDLAEFGMMVRYWRFKRGLTMAALGRLAGVSKGLICKLEKGGANPTLATARSICKALGITYYLG
jgi:transcriptional regulator with XRE-family HTH domain